MITREIENQIRIAIRTLLTLFLILLAYFETGLATALCLILIWVGLEAGAIKLRDILNRLKRLENIGL